MPAVDIVIVNFRGAADTLQALQRLAPWRHGVVWLVDNSAHEPGYAGEAAQLRDASAALPGVRLLAPGDNLGFGRACNLAFAQSTAPLLLLLNPDARIAEPDILALAAHMAGEPRLAALSPAIWWNDARSFLLPSAFPQTPMASLAQALATRAPTLARWAARRYVRRMKRLMQGSQAFAVDFIAGSVLLLRRAQVLAAGGLFDPDYFMFFEDADLSLRLRRAGCRLAVLPTAHAVHEYRHKAFKAGMMADSQARYFSKQFPAFHRFSHGLRRVHALARPVELAQWYTVLPGTVADAAAFAALTQQAGVVAFSPSQLAMPAIFRPDALDSQPFSQAEWDLLEPGPYVALLQPAQSPRLHWVAFTR